MIRRTIALCALVVGGTLGLTSGLAMAEGYGEQTKGQQPGMTESKRLGMPSDGAKMSVAPHSIMMQTSLQSALDYVRGLKSQVKVIDKPTTESMEHYKMMGKNISEEISMARTQQGQLQTNVQKYPDLAANEDFKGINPALRDAEMFNKDFQMKLGDKSYWNNKTMVMSDLDKFEQKLTAAIDRTKDFSAKGLNVFTEIG